MKHFALLPAVLLVGLAFVFEASAAEQGAVVEPDDAAVRICAQYGPGYQAIPGTTTCIKVSGDVEIDASASGGRSK